MPEQPPETPRLGSLIIYVPEVQRAVEYYQRVFGLPCRFVHSSGLYAELETGATALAFADEALADSRAVFAHNRPTARAAGAEVTLVVNDIWAAYQRAVACGATPVIAPVAKPWGQTTAFVRDLNGFLVSLCKERTG